MAENVVNDILKWLETQLQRNEGIKIDTIANKSGYSKWHLQRIFKDFKGCTLGEYRSRRNLPDIRYPYMKKVSYKIA